MKSAEVSKSIVLIALIVLIGGGIRLVLLRYKRVPVRVASGSMAPALIGPHAAATCPDCGITVRYSLEHAPSRPVVCGNCGCDAFQNDFAEHDGDQAAIDQQFRSVGAHSRWKMLAFVDPQDPTRLTVKRLVGLPGEAISIENGDVFADGERIEKSLAELLAVAIPVHDDRHSLAHQDRWQWEGSAKTRQLVYHHWRCFASPLGARGASPIQDAYESNQGLSRSLNIVADIGCICTVQSRGSQNFGFTFRQLEPPIHVQFDFSRQTLVARVGEKTFATVRLDHYQNAAQFRLIMAWCDGRLLVGINNRAVLQARPDFENLRTVETSTPLAFELPADSIRVANMRVFRDIHYLPPRGFSGKWRQQEGIADNRLFVLGDNSPDSRDSRYWKTGLTEEQVVGEVVR